MDPLPCYSSSFMSPPTYEASVAANSQHDESIWPRNYHRQTPRINVAKFYHDLVLNYPHLDDDDDDDDMDDDQYKYDYRRSLITEQEDELEGKFPPSPPSSPALSLQPSVSSSSSLSSPTLATSSSLEQPSTPSSSSSAAAKTSSLSSLLDHHHHHTITELNRLLLQTWSNTDSTIPSYEAFKAKVNSHDFRPIPNTFR